MLILVFGDSITYGACDTEGGWVQRLRKFLDDKTLSGTNNYFSVYNLGIGGDDTNDLVKRFELETRPRFREGEETLFVFAIGINDSHFIHSKNGLGVITEKFKNNLEFLISAAKQLSQKIVFVGLTPVDEPKTTPIPWHTDVSYKNDDIQKYDEIIKGVCEENRVNYIEIFDKLTTSDLKDGLHPSSHGHQIIFEIIKNFLIKNKII